MTTLVIAEHDNDQLKAATLHTVSAALKLSNGVDVLVVGDSAKAVAIAASKIAGVGRVLLVEAPHLADGLAENVAAQVVAIAKPYSHVFFPATTAGKNIAPRVAAKLDSSQISDVIAVDGVDTFQRPIYAGNAIATVQTTDSVIVATIRITAFEPARDGGDAKVENVAALPDSGLSNFICRNIAESDRPELTSARVVISGGRGLGSAESFALLDPLAKKLSAAIGASRAAVDSGYASNDLQVGQTGKIVAPELYIAVGISGAIQHLAGMKDSKVIVAVNKDAEAPIFGVADYGLVGDLFDILPQLEQGI
ncbi:electron transfer flavoprotein subunit alpha/FixB family protein [Caballeronia sordidicola]|uniref:electron transfer flavoprotein subunit alpha/FixB family protein n=1 Tax=Caballeronia sordidicola TaxID=196367 RepID=UPI0004D012A5|nr:electron transfer flavoprotein subunit alpha/FixB family protein [Caballeronia sordidicola]